MTDDTENRRDPPTTGAKPLHTGDRIGACLEMTELTWQERCVLGWYAWKDGSGGAFQSYDTARAALEIGERQFRDIMTSLKRKGRIDVAKRGQVPALKKIAYDEPFRPAENPPVGDESKPAENPPPDRRKTRHLTGITTGRHFCDHGERCNWRMTELGDSCRCGTIRTG